MNEESSSTKTGTSKSKKSAKKQSDRTNNNDSTKSKTKKKGIKEKKMKKEKETKGKKMKKKKVKKETEETNAAESIAEIGKVKDTTKIFEKSQPDKQATVSTLAEKSNKGRANKSHKSISTITKKTMTDVSGNNNEEKTNLKANNATKARVSTNEDLEAQAGNPTESLPPEGPKESENEAAELKRRRTVLAIATAMLLVTVLVISLGVSLSNRSSAGDNKRTPSNNNNALPNVVSTARVGYIVAIPRGPQQDLSDELVSAMDLLATDIGNGVYSRRSLSRQLALNSVLLPTRIIAISNIGK